MKNITMKQFIFLITEKDKFVSENKTEKFENPEEMMKYLESMFIHISNKMLESDDKEIKIELSRFLMLQGFIEFCNGMGSVINKYKDAGML